MRVLQFNSWTEWNTSKHNKSNADVIYSGPVNKCALANIKNELTSTKYIIILLK
jgi:hypothetical protein